jgi:DNA-directed RNA polymerase, mitochondrial
MSIKTHLKRLRQQDLTEEYQCLNTLQRTEWRINKKVLEVTRNLWDNGHQVGKLPSREDLPLPPYPFDKEPNELTEEERELFRTWSGKRNQIYSLNNRSMSKRVQVERTLKIAEQYSKYDRFYYVWQNDFRSRKYASSTFLSTQSADWSKALLEFSYPMPITNWDEARWLCIHGANLFGNDKVSLDEREAWAWDFAEKEASRIVDNPYDNRLWLEADKPFQFLSWCYEMSGLLREGWGFETRLPCAADGSCNGLQHLSAILLDERGGKATNLIAGDLPQDIYTQVAEETTRKIKQDDTELARKCLEFGIDRKICKRSVMIVPYSGTRHACREYIAEAIEERIEKGQANPFGDDLFEVSHYLSIHVWDAIADVIVSARKVMKYLKDVSAVYAEHNTQMEWITPTGWLVLQNYSETDSKRIKTHINGNTVSLSFIKDRENTVNRKRTNLGSSPNFIHSLDAAAMTKTINKAVTQGVEDFAMVHDSYGTHSTHMPRLSSVLREEFVNMYEQHDVLTELRDHATIVLGTQDIPEPPSKGNLDLRGILKSQYFFA